MKFQELFKLYFEKHVLVRTKCPANAHYFFTAHGPRWKDVPVESITRSALQDWCDEISLRSPSSATRAVNMVSAIINWGIRRGYLPPGNPCSGVEKFSIKSRKRFMSTAEIERFKTSLDQEPDVIRDFFLMCLATGARRGNVLSMSWDQINIDQALWMIPDTKNGDEHVVPLSGDALTILHRCFQRSKESPWVFPSDSPSGHLVCVKRAFERIINRACIADLRIHDLRRTVGSYMAINGESAYVIGAMLGHRDPRSTAVYARLNVAPIRAAIESVHSKWQLTPPDQQPAPGHAPGHADVRPELSITVIESETPAEPSRPVLNSRVDEATRIKVEAKILQVLGIRARTKTGFRRLKPSLGADVELILSGMVERGVIERFWDCSTRHHVQRYRLVKKEAETDWFERPVTPTNFKSIEWDDVTAGLGIRHYKKCRKWIVKFRIDGKQKMITLGDADVIPRAEARIMANQERQGGVL